MCVVLGGVGQLCGVARAVTVDGKCLRFVCGGRGEERRGEGKGKLLLEFCSKCGGWS